MIKQLAAMAAISFSLSLGGAASAQLAPGTQSEGRLQAEFSGVITEVKTKGKKTGFRADVTLEGNLESGMPFTAEGDIQIATDQAVQIGDQVRGRFRADGTGEILERTPAGVRFSGTGDMFRVEWMTQQFGGTSKGGGTNVFRLEGWMGLGLGE